MECDVDTQQESELKQLKVRQAKSLCPRDLVSLTQH